MGLMFARRRQEAKKHAAEKAKAHADNHKRVKELHAKTAPAPTVEAKAEDGALKRGAK